MPSLFEHLAARIARIHARRVYGRFSAALTDVAATQQRVLDRLIPLVSESEFGRRHNLRTVRSVADLRRAVPLTTYEDYRPLIDRVCDGDSGALFSPGRQILMLATSSGTTAAPKRIPVTREFVNDYRRGWNTFGLKMLSDHPAAILRHILQSSGRHDASHTPAGIPCGAITGLLAQTQKRIVRRFYVGRPEITRLPDAAQRYYTLMRLGIARDVAFAITANPATLIQMARIANEQSDTLLRDVHDGTLADSVVDNTDLRAVLSTRLRPDPQRAAELERLRSTHGVLRPRDYWKLEFLACWTAGSMGHYLDRLADWWGPVPVRDIGLLASEGRVSMPLDDGTPVGPLDITSAVFEFIPAEQADAGQPDVLGPREIETGRDYVVVLSNTTGLLRYRLDDVVRVHGHLGQTPLIEFLHRAGRVASVAGEKLTENHAVAAVRAACAALNRPALDFVLAPCWAEPPYYRLSCHADADPALADAIDQALREQNEEYDSRRKSRRLGPLTIRPLPADAIPAMDARLLSQRLSTPEQYKRPCLFTTPGDDDQSLGLG